MVVYIRLGWRNIWRNKRRSLVVISSIGVGVFSMLIVTGVLNGMNYQMVDNIISTSLGHVSVHRTGLSEDYRASYNFIPSDELCGSLDRTEGVTGWAPRIKIQGMISSSEASQGVLITGIDPEREKKVSQLFEYTSKSGGSGYLDNPAAAEVLISEQLAEKLGLVAGDRLVIVFQDSRDVITGEALTVKGLFRSPIDSFDKYVIFTGITKLQSVTGMEKRVSEISVRTATRDDSIEVKTRVQRLVKDPVIEVQTWQEMAPSMMSAIRLFDTMILIFFAIIFTTVIFSVANTMVMAVMERFHEIGVMKCIGTRPRNIFIMILSEAVNLGLAGMAAGVCFGMIVNTILGITGFDLSIFSESMRIWGTGSVIYPLVMFKDIAGAVVIVFTTAVSAAVFPAIKAAKIKPLEALNYI